MLARLSATRGLPRLTKSTSRFIANGSFIKRNSNPVVENCMPRYRRFFFGRHFHSSRTIFDVKRQDAKTIASEGKSRFSYGLGQLTRFVVMSTGVLALTCGGALVGFFIYDSTTYKESNVPEAIEVANEALRPPVGGPENLPIFTARLDGHDDEMKQLTSYKPKLVILGSGWASVGLLKNLKKGDYDVTVISPQNYFLFTPLLPSAATGTLEIKSLMASIRKIVGHISGHYLEGKAEKIEFKDKMVKVSQVLHSNNVESRSFYVPYDKLVIAVGSTANTHGVQGLEYCDRLKTAEDALLIKKKIKGLLELACLPTTTEEERKKLLSFVVCGGGPTGVEFAAEVFDLLNEDLPRSYPKVLRQQVSVHIIQSRSHILNTYDEKISEYAMERFKKESIDLLTNSRVERILPDKVIFNQKDPETGKIECKELPFGLCLWSTGVAQNPLAKNVVKSFQDNQRNKRAIETDSQLRIIGNPAKDVYAIGDCSTVRTDLAENTVNYMRNFVTKKHIIGDQNPAIISKEDVRNISLTYDEIRELCRQVSRLHPQTRESFIDLDDNLPTYDIEKKGSLNFEQLTKLLKKTEAKVTSLPATAQRANQQGSYLGKKLTKLARYTNDYIRSGQSVPSELEDVKCKPFKYVRLGSLAYIGNSAVFDLPGYSFVGGLIAMYLWRGAYFIQTVSLRTRVLLFMDWLKRGLFGRDIIDTS